MMLVYMDNMNQGIHGTGINMNQGTANLWITWTNKSGHLGWAAAATYLKGPFFHRRTTIASSLFKLYIQHWTTELKRITAGSCLTLNMMPCTRFQGQMTVKNVDPCLTWYNTRPTEDDPSLSRNSTTSSLCTTWPPGPWARMDVKHSQLPKNSKSQSILPLATCFSLKSDKPRTTGSSHSSRTWTWMMSLRIDFSKLWVKLLIGLPNLFTRRCLRSWAKHDNNVPWRRRNSPRWRDIWHFGTQYSSPWSAKKLSR